MEVLIAGVLLLGGVWSLAYLARTAAGIAEFNATRGEVVDLQRYVRSLSDCTQTFTAAVRTSCTGATGTPPIWVNVRRSGGTVFISSAGTTQTGVVRTFGLRAKCVDLSGFFGLLVEYQEMGKAGEGAAILGATGAWLPLSKGVPLACP